MRKSCLFTGFFILLSGMMLFIAFIFRLDAHLVPRFTQKVKWVPPLTMNAYTMKKGEDLSVLLEILENRLKEFSNESQDLTSFTCDQTNHTATPCFDQKCPGHFSLSPRKRLQEVLATRTEIPLKYRSVIMSSTQHLTSHKYIFVTAASSNHYQELQGLVDNVFNNLFPLMKNQDYLFIFYDIGLTREERILTEQNCRCTILDFPFSQLPAFMENRMCYVWKTIIIASLLEKAEYLVWMDTSIRWHNSTPLDTLFRRAKERGYQGRVNTGSIAVRTVHSMAYFFGDQLCRYSPFGEMETGISFYYNDRFMREVILQPWLSCAFNQTCMCVKDYRKLLNCAVTPPRRNGRCHRFEQSSIGVILSKLFQGHRPMLYLPHNSVKVIRGHKMNWFKKQL